MDGGWVAEWRKRFGSLLSANVERRYNKTGMSAGTRLNLPLTTMPARDGLIPACTPTPTASQTIRVEILRSGTKVSGNITLNPPMAGREFGLVGLRKRLKVVLFGSFPPSIRVSDWQRSAHIGPGWRRPAFL